LQELRIPPGNRLEALGGDRKGQYSIRINDLVNGRRGVTPSSALRLAKFFGNSPDFWMNLQLRWDLYFAQQSETKVIETIQPYKHTGP
jgi:plasmid maintenance system antidote protein VapI